MDEEQLIEALANVHIEYILIHPFREGLDNVEPMKEIFRQVLHASQQNVGE